MMAAELRPQINVSNQTFVDLAPEVLQHMIEQQADAPRIFAQRSGTLVRIRDHGKGSVEVLRTDSLIGEVARVVQFIEPTRFGVPRNIDPPVKVIKHILTADNFEELPQFPELRRVAHVPFFAASGELIDKYGYHPEQRTYLQQTKDDLISVLAKIGPIPTEPSIAQIAAARSLLVGELLGDFAFVSPASRAHTLALLIAPFMREIIGNDSSIPMAAVLAPEVKSGKSLLSSVPVLVVSGEKPPVMTSKIGDEEWQKMITAFLLDGPLFGVIDNAIDKIDSPALAALLTSREWRGRILGHSKMTNLRNDAQWLVNGNMLTFTPEIARRSLTIALDARTRPATYEYKHSPLEPWIIENRPRIVHAILTLIQHWLIQGRPPFTARELGSFENYVRTVGGVLQAAALDEGFLTPTLSDEDYNIFTERGDFTVAKDADADLVTLVKEWAKAFGYEPRRVKHIIECAPASLINNKTWKDRAIGFGRLLQKNIGRVIAGHRIVAVKVRDEDSREVNGFRLVEAA